MHAAAERRRGAPPEDAFELPTRQKNVLRNLLDKPEISPEEVATLGYRVIERAPGVGKQSLDVIRKWLGHYGLDLSGIPANDPDSLAQRRRRKIESAIGYLKAHGYEVRRAR